MPMIPFFNLRRYGFSKLDPASLHDYVYVVIRSAKEAISHITPYHESPYV